MEEEGRKQLCSYYPVGGSAAERDIIKSLTVVTARINSNLPQLTVFSLSQYSSSHLMLY